MSLDPETNPVEYAKAALQRGARKIEAIAEELKHRAVALFARLLFAGCLASVDASALALNAMVDLIALPHGFGRAPSKTASAIVTRMGQDRTSRVWVKGAALRGEIELERGLHSFRVQEIAQPYSLSQRRFLCIGIPAVLDGAPGGDRFHEVRSLRDFLPTPVCAPCQLKADHTRRNGTGVIEFRRVVHK